MRGKGGYRVQGKRLEFQPQDPLAVWSRDWLASD